MNKLQRTKGNQAAILYADVVKTWNLSSDIDGIGVPPALPDSLKLRNRGGLIQVTNELYGFMREVECAIRPIIHVDFHRFRDIDLVSSLVTELKNNKLVLAS